jgi:hypothetical protein
MSMKKRGRLVYMGEGSKERCMKIRRRLMYEGGIGRGMYEYEGRRKVGV